MKKVRVSVFETNSSSMHSLSIGSDKKMEVLDASERLSKMRAACDQLLKKTLKED